MDRKFHFTVSSIIALGIYVLFVFLIVLYLKNSDLDDTQKFASMPEETLVELDFILDDVKNVELESIEEKIIENNIEQPSDKESSQNNSEPNLKSLFSNVSEIGTKKIEEKVEEKPTKQSASRFQSKIDSTKKIEEKIELSKLVDLKNLSAQSKSLSTPSSKGNFDEYYSRINSDILKKWYRYPLLTDYNYFVSANITIDVNGNFSFVILKYSGNTVVDKAVKEFLKSQTFEKYRPHPDNTIKTIKINFMPFVR